MSAEHGGGHGGESVSFTSIIVSFLLMFTFMPAVTEIAEEAVQKVAGPNVDGHG